MGREVLAALASIALAIVGLASLSVLLSPNAQTAQVTQAATQGFGADLTAAVAPVTGGSSGLGSLSLGSSSLTSPTLY